MARKRFTAEQIVIKLREAEVSQAQGKTVVQVCKQLGVTEQDLLPVEEGVWGSEDGPGQASEVAGEGECPSEEAGGGSVPGQPDFEGSLLGKLLGPAKRRRAVVWVRERFGPERVSERRACRVLGTGQVHPTKSPADSQGRGTTGDPDGGVGQSVWPIRVPEDHGDASLGGVEGEPQASGKALEAGRAEGPVQTAETKETVAP